MEHYSQCLARRMKHWLRQDVEVSQREGDWLEVGYSGCLLQIRFCARSCSWSLVQGEFKMIGSFDRVTKKMRQILTKA